MYYEYHFSNVAEFLAAALHPRNDGAGTWSDEKGSEDFTGSKNLSEAIALCKSGWSEGRERIAAMSARITRNIALKMHKPIITFDVSGDTFDIGRVVTGVPECFMQWDTEETTEKGMKVIKLVTSTAVSGSIPKEIISIRGAAVCALVECLEAAGFRLEVCTNEHTTKRGDHLEYNICVKESTQQIQMDQLAFVLVHPSFLRRIEFRFSESSFLPAKLSVALTANGSYGHPENPSNHLKGDITLGCMTHGDPNFASEAAAEQWVIAQLQAQGIELEK